MLQRDILGFRYSIACLCINVFVSPIAESEYPHELSDLESSRTFTDSESEAFFGLIKIFL